MPLIKVQTNVVEIPPDDAQVMLNALSKLLAEAFGKSESYVMTILEPAKTMTFGGVPGPAAYMEIKNIGTMTNEQTQVISKAACELAYEHLGVPPERTYLEFCDAKRHLWGWNRKTFI